MTSPKKKEKYTWNKLIKCLTERKQKLKNSAGKGQNDNYKTSLQTSKFR